VLLANDSRDAVRAIAAIHQLCRVHFEESVTGDGDPLGEDLSQDGLARSGRYEHWSVLSMEDMDDPAAAPIRNGMAKESHFRRHRRGLRCFGLHRPIGTQIAVGLQERGWPVAGAGANSPEDMLVVVWATGKPNTLEGFRYPVQRLQQQGDRRSRKQAHEDAQT
jgi:hypothetical protein